jgi:hypothetical protein
MKRLLSVLPLVSVRLVGLVVIEPTEEGARVHRG